MFKTISITGLLLAAVGLPALFLGAGCSRLSEGSQTKNLLVLTGSSTIAPLINDMAKRFEAINPGTRIDVQTGGSSRGVADARRGLADIGMVSRALNSEENDLTAHTIARDGVCIIVHRDNPISSLSDEQIVSIYSGAISNWRQLGGDDAEITVVTKSAGRSTLELFLHYFKLQEKQIQPDVVIGDNAQGIKTVAGSPQSIGYVSIGSAEYEASQGVPIKLLPIGSIVATVQNVSAGTFPLSRPLNLVTIGKPEGLTKQFIDYTRSAVVADLIEEHFFVAPVR